MRGVKLDRVAHLVQWCWWRCDGGVWGAGVVGWWGGGGGGSGGGGGGGGGLWAWASVWLKLQLTSKRRHGSGLDLLHPRVLKRPGRSEVRQSWNSAVLGFAMTAAVLPSSTRRM